jgi:hypothetical protein
MTDTIVPPAVQRMLDATNRADTDAFVAAFSDDAYLNDWGREFHGRSGAASWNQTDNIGVQAHLDLRGVRPGDESDHFFVDVTVRSNRFNGEGTFDIRIKDNLITQLVVS